MEVACANAQVHHIIGNLAAHVKGHAPVEGFNFFVADLARPACILAARQAQRRQRLRAADHVLNGADLLNMPVVHHADTLAQAARFVDVVAHVEHGAVAYIEQVEHVLLEGALEVRIERTHGLISLSHSQYIQGNFPPNHHFDVTSGIQSQHNELVAHARAVNLYKDLDETEHLGGRIGMVNVLTPAYPATDSPADQHAADLYNAFYTDFIMDGAFLGHYSARTLSLINEILRANNATLTVEDSDMEELAKAAPRNDMFGLNYYQSAFIAAYDGESTNSFNGTGDKGTSCFKFKGVGQQVDMPGIPTTDWDWLIYPQGLYDTLKHISATYPNLPVIYITENGLGHKDPEPDANGIVADPERIDFVDQHMEKVLQARAEGVDVQGYFIWSLQDQFSWANGYNKRYGLFYIDFDTQKRYIKQSALWYKELADTMADAQ